MKGILLAASVGLSLSLGLAVTDPAWSANEWGIPGEEKARFEAKVVDVQCELTGNCPANCGAGKRQLGLLTPEGKLVLPLKNQTIFSGAALELVDFCGKQVVADGLMITNRGYTFFALQFVREAPDGKWRKANRFLPKWAEANGLDAKDKKVKQWFRHDPQVKAIIEADGIFGLGAKVDKDYLDSQQ